MRNFLPIEQIRLITSCKTGSELLFIREQIEENQQLSGNAHAIYNLKMNNLLHANKF